MIDDDGQSGHKDDSAGDDDGADKVTSTAATDAVWSCVARGGGAVRAGWMGGAWRVGKVGGAEPAGGRGEAGPAEGRSEAGQAGDAGPAGERGGAGPAGGRGGAGWAGKRGGAGRAGERRGTGPASGRGDGWGQRLSAPTPGHSAERAPEEALNRSTRRVPWVSERG